jgi:MoaA/NifB/PqqE/SkfB family radical SAM enzyme
MISATDVQRMILNAKYMWRIRKHRVAIRYVRKLLAAKVFSTITPRQIDIALTFRCNLECKHCFATPLHRTDGTELSYETLTRVAADCYAMGITVIHFTGGEILLREDLADVIRLFRPRDNIIYVQSNGTLADQPTLERLRTAGLDFFSVSLEAPDSRSQDQFRNYKGYFDNALATLRMAQQLGLQTSVNLTIDRELLHSPSLSKLITKLGDQNHIVYANLPVPVGRYRGKREVLWNRTDRLTLYALTRAFPHLRTEFDSNLGGYGCPAMKEKIYLCAYGDVIPCPYIHVSFGNVNNESLSAIRDRCLSYPMFQSYNDHCLAAENEAFIREIICETYKHELQPVPYQVLAERLENRNGVVPIHLFDDGRR